ncbi:CLUMA_CG010308, isoform A [Clunio marinus]|uniref:CLUMA_CG010308, isoform A n=1 Tax=Clunio marinus TaxID=568069 RepID=A0A1J1ID67_9DIPT|nr:CLUMA_CG010308, isoform A [Clunio marinus]
MQTIVLSLVVTEEAEEMTSCDRSTMPEDSDSDGSEVTANSTVESNDESLSDNVEVAKVLDHKFHLPKDLCEHSEIFKEFFSIDTWNLLSGNEKTHLLDLLPEFPQNNGEEREKTIEMLFANTLTRFNQTPLDVFHSNLQDGNYRPDIAYYRRSILKAEEREQQIKECERISLLAEKLVCSREKLLRSAYRCPPGSLPQLPHSSSSVPRLSSSSAAMRANRRYFQEISKITEELGVKLSDDETVPDGINVQLTKKQIKQFTEQGSLSPGAELRIVGTTSTKEKNWDHLTSHSISAERYKQMLLSYKKRKLIEPDHPEMEIDEIKLKDIFSRTQLTVNPKKLMTGINASNSRKSLLMESKMKHDNQYSMMTTKFTGSSSSTMIGKNLKMTNKNSGNLTTKKYETQSETDEEDWIKANIIKVEPNDDQQVKGSQKLPIRQQKMSKTIQQQQSGRVPLKRPRSSTENSNTQIRAGKKIIIDAGNVMKSSFVNKNNSQMKKIVINPRPLPPPVDPMDFIESCDEDDIDNSPESRHELQACFLSLIRDIFCSTRDHRMKLEELRNRTNIWLSNSIAPMNDWFTQANDWGGLLISAVHFLSGEFQDQPEDFVPYLEFKSQLNIYQWIGAGRDSDTRMVSLYQYWLSRRHEMGIKAVNVLKNKNLGKTFISPEKNEENHLQQAVSPPNDRCRTEWKVQTASESEIREFQEQERQRYENPHLPFTYRQHGYESVVGPLKGIYSQSPAASKARDHNTLIAERPNFVTILALVRDAAARLPNGEGTRWDICELLKSSQYIASGISDVIIQSIVSSALDRMHTEQDPCIKYDTKRKLWIYVHRNRSEMDFERIHQQQQQIFNKQKKPVFKKATKLDGQQQQMMIIPSSAMRCAVVSSPNLAIRTYQTKGMTTTTAACVKPIQSLTTFDKQNKSQISPPPLKISPKRYIKSVTGNDQAIDVEASLDAHTTPIVKTSDVKGRLSLKNASPIRFATSTSIIGSYQSSPVNSSGQQSLIINSNRSQSPKVTSIIGTKKVGTSPLIVNQTPQSSSYLIPMKQQNEPPALSVAGKSPSTSVIQQKNLIKVNTSGGKNIISPQHPQKIILTSSALQNQKGGKIISAVGIQKNQTSPVTMLSQQKQILTNVIVQQQKAKGQQNQIIATNNQQQKLMPGLTISSASPNTSQSQLFQIQQSSSDGKITTVSPANLTPQQRQTIFQSLKQFKAGGNQQTMIVKPHVMKTNEVPTPPLVSVSGSVGKVMKSGMTTMIQQPPQVIVSMAPKSGESGNSSVMARVVSSGGRQLMDGVLTKPGTTFKITGANTAGQSGLLQLSASSGSQVTQYAVVSKGKNIISLNNQTKMITTQAQSSPTQLTVNSSSPSNVSPSISQQSNQSSPGHQQQQQQIKIVPGGSITAQQLIGAKLINVQSLANKGIKTTGGIKMINSPNYIANIGGKPLIIANKANTSTSGNTNSQGGLMLQTNNASNGAFILNSQGQPLKVQGNILTQGNINQPNTSQPQTVMLGNQIVKVQSLQQIQQKVNNQTSSTTTNAVDGQRPIILGSTIKVLKNVIKSNNQPQQQTNRVVLAAPGTQSGQFAQQIILPANFQGLKTLQGLKVIQGSQGSSDRVFAARLMTSSNTNNNNNNPGGSSNANSKTSNVTSSQEEVKE